MVTNIPECITQKAIENSSAKLNPEGSILVAMYGATIGKLGILTFPATTNQACCACIEYPAVEQMYLFYFLYAHKEEFIRLGGGGAQPNISKDIIIKTPIPIPPINEQKRIVAEIKKYLLFLEQIEDGRSSLEHAASNFKTKVLDLAISGRLVPQDPSDEPAIELLKRINPDFKACDISQYPYDIPCSWQFATLGEVTSFLSRGKSPKYSEERKYPVFAQKCNQWEGITLEKVQFLEPSTLQKWPDEYKLQDGDVLINSTGTGTLGRTGIFYKNILGGYPFILPDSHVTVVRGNKEILSQEYLFLISRSLYMQKWMIDNMVGSTNQKELYPKALEGFMLAIPPRAEQDRIVSYVKRLIDKVQSLVQNI